MRTARRTALAVSAALTGLALCMAPAAATPAGRARSPHSGVGYVTAVSTRQLDRLNLAAVRLRRPFTVGGAPLHLAVAPGGKMACVASGNGTVSAIDPATGQVKAVINVGGFPFAVAIRADGLFCYAALLRSVVVIDTTSLQVVKQIAIPEPPALIAPMLAMAPSGTTLYLLSESAQTVTEIDTATNSIQATLSVAVCFFAPVFSPDGRIMYLLTSGGVVPVNTSTGTAGPLVPQGSCTGDLLLTGNGSTLYASGNAAGQAHVARLNVTASGLHLAWRTWVHKYPTSMALRGTTLFVSTGLHPFITPIDAASGKAGRLIKDHLRVGNGAPVLDSCGRYLFVPFGGFLVAAIAVINPATRHLVRVIREHVRTLSAAVCSRAQPVLLTLLQDPSHGHGWLLPVSGTDGQAGRLIALDGEPTGIVFS